MRVLLAVFVAAGLGLAGSATAQVTAANDPDPAVDGTLRFEIDNAGAGDVIDVQVGAAGGLETISLRTTLVFGQNLTLDNSSDDTALVDVDAPASATFLEIQGGVNVVLRDLGLAGDPAISSDDIDLQGATSLLTIDAERAAQLVAVDIVGLGGLRKEGSQSLELSGVNTFAGGITVEDGDLIGEVRSLGTGTITLAPDAATETARLVFDFAGTDTLSASGPAIADGSSGGATVGIVKRGAGTLDVTAATIAASLDFDVADGTLRVGGTQMTNGHDFEVASEATLEIDPAAGAFASAGVFSGAGTIDVEADALTLNADPSGFTGTFEVNPGPTPSAGSLVVGVLAAPTAALTFDAVADGADTDFTLNDTVGVTWAGDMSGTGRFVKAGAGTTTLTGTHVQAAGTRVVGGALIGSTTSLPGNVGLASGTTLTFSQGFDATYDGILSSLSGTATVRKLGEGVLRLTQDQLFAGDFRAERGGLQFAHGADLASNLSIGNGAVGGVTNLSADFDPTGVQDNTVTIGGALSFDADARVTVGVEPTANRSTVFGATGAVTIQPGAILAVETADGIYSAADTWDVITGSSVTGSFAVEQSLFFFTIGQSIVSGNTLRLSLAPSGATLSAAAMTSNGLVIGGQLDGFLGATFPGGSIGEEYQQAIISVTADEVPALLGSVSPDDLAAGTQIQLANAHRTWRGLSDRMALRRSGGVGRGEDARPARRTRPSVAAGGADRERTEATPGEGEQTWTAWIEGGGLIGELSSDEAKSFDYLSAGPIVGADRALGDDARIGFALSGGAHRYETSDGDGEGDGGGVEGTLYGAWLGEPVEVVAGLRYAWAELDTERTIRVGSIADRAEGELEADVMGAFLELTRGFDLPGAIEIAPLASVAWTGVRWAKLDESGPSPLAVQVDEQEVDSILTTVGVRLAVEREMEDDLWIRPRTKVLWNREWGDVERDVSGRFASDPTTGLGPFVVEGAEVPTDHAEIAVGWEVGFTDNANLFFDWQGRFGEDLVENAFSAGGRVVW